MKRYMRYIVILSLVLYNSCGLLKPSPVYDSISRYDYLPFSEKTKVAVLKKDSIYKLENNLPILDGATALYPLYAAFVQAVYPEGEYSLNIKWDDDYKEIILPLVGTSRTSEAYKNLINGKVDIIFCAKPSAEQIEMAKKEGLTFNMTPIGKEAFVFFVNKKNKISNISIENIKNIYFGKITKWSELGGKNNPIKIYQRPKNSGSQTMLESIMEGEKIIEPLTEETLDFMLSMVTEVSMYRNYSNAIGYSFLFFTTQMVQDNKIKLLSINGVLPSVETVQMNTYPYSDYFYAITTDTKNENVNSFIKWILSEQGQYLVKETGYVPIN
jgi:phosphate transport system substrate-binding protein